MMSKLTNPALKKPVKRGAPPKYPLRNLTVGKSVTIKIDKTPLWVVRSAVYAAGVRWSWKFTTKTVNGNLRVKRVK
jgi:hypothetical protein